MNGCHFCGVAESLFGRRSRVRKWDRRDLRWMVVDFIPGISQPAQISAYRYAFSQWSDVCDLRFTQTTDQSIADFLIGTRNIDGDGGTLAEHQLPYGNDEQLRGWFDVGDKWAVRKPHEPGLIDLVTVATHEFGHGIGLGHISAPGNLLNPIYNPAITKPQSADIAEAVKRYGPPKVTPAPEPDPEPDIDVSGRLLSIEPITSWGQRVEPGPGSFVVATDNIHWVSPGNLGSRPVAARGIYLGNGLVAKVDVTERTGEA